MVTGQRLKALAFTLRSSLYALDSSPPFKGRQYYRLPLEGVLVLLHAQLVQRDVVGLLLPDVLGDRRLVQADGGHVVALRPELPVAELVLEVGVPVEYHQRALPLQVAHDARDAVLRAGSPAARARGRASGAPRLSRSPCTRTAS